MMLDRLVIHSKGFRKLVSIARSLLESLDNFRSHRSASRTTEKIPKKASKMPPAIERTGMWTNWVGCETFSQRKRESVKQGATDQLC